jgi:hypothetical protein
MAAAFSAASPVCGEIAQPAPSAVKTDRLRTIASSRTIAGAERRQDLRAP